MFKTLRLTFFIVLSFFLSQCNTDSSLSDSETSPEEISQAYIEYISAYTSGVISNESSIIIDFTEAVPGAIAGKVLEEDLFSFDPEIEGEASWTSDRSILFTPNDILSNGASYTGDFKLSKVLQGISDDLEIFPLRFEIMDQYMIVEYGGVEAYDPKDLSWQKVTGSIATADFASDELIEEALVAKQNGQNLSISWEHDEANRSHTYRIDSVERTESEGEVVLNWDGKKIHTQEKGTRTIKISPLGNFELLNTDVVQQPDQYITLYFSDPVNTSQDLEGLIYLSSGDDLRLKVEGNEIKAYTTSRLTANNTIKIEKGVRNTMNYQLSKRYEQEVKFVNIKPKIELIGNGVITPNADGFIFPFKAVNLNAVNVKIIQIFTDNIAQYLQVNQMDGRSELKRVGRIVYKGSVPLNTDKAIDKGNWNTYSLDLSKFIETSPGAIYRVVMSFDRHQSIYPCKNQVTETVEVTSSEEIGDDFYDQPGGYYNDYEYDYYYNDGYNWNEKEDPCKESYYLRGRHVVARNLLASNLGIIAKQADGSNLFVAVTDMNTTNPVANAKIDIYNYQNQIIGQGTTDVNGLVTLPLDKRPFLLVASNGNDRGYLRLDDGSSLSLSMFDVSGEKTKQGVKGFIYGERGVWRPGDSLFVSFVLEDKQRSLPENHPVIFELYTPENQLYHRRVRTQSVNGFYDFRTITEQSAPTGNWLAKIKVGGSEFTKTLKIETVKPNRLKIDLDFGTEVLKSSSPAQGQLTVKWLHGAIAKNLKTDVEVSLEKGNSSFDGYESYRFDDPAKEFYAEEDKIFEGMLDARGQATVNAKMQVGKNAPGLLRAKFKVRAFEKGGDFSVDRFTMPYSTYDSYVGVKVPKGTGWNDALYSNEPNLIPIVTVDENGNKIDRKKLKIEIFRINWRWWWHRSGYDDLASYVADRSTNLIQTDYVDTKNGEAKYQMNLNTDSWGRKMIRITDPISGHSTGQIFYTSYKGWWSTPGQNNPGGAEMLTFTTDKTNYKVGEQVKINLPSTAKGKALVSIESSADIIQTFWVDTDANTKTVEFEATAKMTPNVYIHISYLQPHQNTANDLPIRMYGVQRISVEDANTHLNPVITMPNELAPEEEVTIKVKESTGRKMTYTLAMVDDGLLDLTRFKTPDAWKKFYAREALGVKTWDMYKYVMGAYEGEIAGLLAVGGDDELNGDKGGKKANRFKPVVKFYGPIELEAGEENSHTFRMPNYVGSVRTMVVAGDFGAYGKTEKTTPVKKPVMVLATMPRVVGPTETIRLPVTVFSMDESIKNVSVELEANDLFTIEGSAKQTVSFTEVGEQMAYFDLKVNEAIGIGKVKIRAKSSKHRAEYDVELDVRLPNPRISKVIDGAIEPGKTWTSPYRAVGMKGTNNGVIEVSGIPSMNLENRLQYLLRYPHGCIEQTTSSVFPQLHLSNLLDLSTEQKGKIKTNIKAGIKRINTFQHSNGGLSYWPGETNYYSDWGTNYAGHFMLEAKAKGYALPSGFLNKWIKYQKRRANEWTHKKSNKHYYYRSDELIQAYRLYTLALAKKPALGAMNRMRELKDLSTAAQWRLAAAFELIGRSKVAQKIITSLDVKIPAYREMSYSYGSNVRDQAMILETLVLMKDRTAAKNVFDELVEMMGSRRWYSTQTTAYSLLAISKFIGNGSATATKELNYQLIINRGAKTSVKNESLISQHDLDVNQKADGSLSITNNGSQTIFVKVQLDGIPVAGDLTNAANDLALEVNYLDMEGNVLNPASIYQGMDFVAQVKVKHPGVRNNYKEMALTQIFPSGWEIRNLRMDEMTSSFSRSMPRYEDIRDDRVLTYFDLKRGQSKTFTVLLNAAYLGKFYLPTVATEAMYDNEINAHQAGMWVEVKAQE